MVSVGRQDWKYGQLNRSGVDSEGGTDMGRAGGRVRAGLGQGWGGGCFRAAPWAGHLARGRRCVAAGGAFVGRVISGACSHCGRPPSRAGRVVPGGGGERGRQGAKKAVNRRCKGSPGTDRVSSKAA